MTHTDEDLEATLFELGKLHSARAADAEGAPAARLRELEALSAEEEHTLVAGALARCAEPIRSSSKALPLARSASALTRLWPVAVAACAAVALTLSWPRSSSEGLMYELSSPGSDALMRDEVPSLAEPSVGPRRYSIGRELRFVLRAARPSAEPARVWIFSPRSGFVPDRAVKVDRQGSGTLVVTLLTGAGGYDPSVGADTLVFALTRSSDRPTVEQVLRDAASGGQFLRVQVVWQTLAAGAAEKPPRE